MKRIAIKLVVFLLVFACILFPHLGLVLIVVLRWALFSAPGYPIVLVALFVAPAVLIPAALLLNAWSSQAPIRDGDRRCVHCGYDLRGAEHEVCPECGGRGLMLE